MNDIMPQPAEQRHEADWTAGLSATDLHRVLSSERRRALLDVLLTQSSPITLDELARAVTIQQFETTEPSPEIVEKVMVTLHHNHLQMLSSLGIVTYDPSTRQVMLLG